MKILFLVAYLILTITSSAQLGNSKFENEVFEISFTDSNSFSLFFRQHLTRHMFTTGKYSLSNDTVYLASERSSNLSFSIGEEVVDELNGYLFIFDPLSFDFNTRLVLNSKDTFGITSFSKKFKIKNISYFFLPKEKVDTVISIQLITLPVYEEVSEVSTLIYIIDRKAANFFYLTFGKSELQKLTYQYIFFNEKNIKLIKKNKKIKVVSDLSFIDGVVLRQK